MNTEPAFKGWTERDLRRVLPKTSSGVQRILAYVASHPQCTSEDIATDLSLKSRRSVGPTLNNLTRTSVELGIFATANHARWPFEFGRKTGGEETYDFPAWVRALVLELLGHA